MARSDLRRRESRGIGGQRRCGRDLVAAGADPVAAAAGELQYRGAIQPLLELGLPEEVQAAITQVLQYFATDGLGDVRGRFTLADGAGAACDEAAQLGQMLFQEDLDRGSIPAGGTGDELFGERVHDDYNTRSICGCRLGRLPRIAGMHDPSDGSDPVEDLMAECFLAPPEEVRERIRQLCAEHSQHAPEIRRRMGVLEGLDLDFEPSDIPGLPERLGDFRILASIGEGGMGLVVRAEQISLGREVALKLVRPERLFFPGARERFRREIEAVARLKHPGIVPVYAVGEERGLPYFAMELVEGRSLADLLTDLAGRDPATLEGADLAAALERHGVVPVREPGSPFTLTWTAAALEIARQVADALEHAHGRGIVHRDVKPSNIAITSRGRAMLLDFGLTSSAGEAKLTRTGSQLGTLYYMSPEQLRGEPADARADVYSLGVTLHEMLTLRHPHQGANAEAIRAAILAGRPERARARNRRVSEDAEVVCQTAMEPDPERRYASAALFAADLEAARAGRAILARPPGRLLRAARWVRRHPTASVGSALGLALIAGVPSALYVQQLAHTTEVTRSLSREARARADAEALLEILFNMVLEATPDRLAGRSLDLSAWIENGLAHLDQLEARGAVMERFLVFAGDALLELGKVDRSIEVLEQAVQVDRERGGALSDWNLKARSSLATALQRRGRYDEAESLFREVIDGWSALHGALDERVAIARNNLASLLADRDRYVEAEQELRKALEVYAPTPERADEWLATLRMNHASMLSHLGRGDEAREEAETAIEVLRALPDEHPATLAQNLSLLGNVCRAQPDWPAAEVALGEALEIFGRILPEGDLYFAATEYKMGDLLELQRRLEEALPYYEAAVAQMERLGLGDHPNTPLFRARRDAARDALEDR